jgi:hypothetical protein
MRDLLPGCASLRWDSYFAALIRMLARVRARVSSSVRPPLRCMGDSYAVGIFADFIRCAVDTAARTTFVSSRVKEDKKVWDRKSEKIRLGEPISLKIDHA